MTKRTSPAAGGILIALGALGGTAIGVVIGQTTAGFLIGTATGVALSLAIWLRKRR